MCECRVSHTLYTVCAHYTRVAAPCGDFFTSLSHPPLAECAVQPLQLEPGWCPDCTRFYAPIDVCSVRAVRSFWSYKAARGWLRPVDPVCVPLGALLQAGAGGADDDTYLVGRAENDTLGAEIARIRGGDGHREYLESIRDGTLCWAAAGDWRRSVRAVQELKEAMEDGDVEERQAVEKIEAEQRDTEESETKETPEQAMDNGMTTASDNRAAKTFTRIMAWVHPIGSNGEEDAARVSKVKFAPLPYLTVPPLPASGGSSEPRQRRAPTSYPQQRGSGGAPLRRPMLCNAEEGDSPASIDGEIISVGMGSDPSTPTSPAPSVVPAAPRKPLRRLYLSGFSSSSNSPSPTPKSPPRPSSRLSSCGTHGKAGVEGCVGCAGMTLRELASPSGAEPQAISQISGIDEAVAAVQPLCYCDECGPSNCITCVARGSARGAIGGAQWL
jgi:hypothetical protein